MSPTRAFWQSAARDLGPWEPPAVDPTLVDMAAHMPWTQAGRQLIDSVGQSTNILFNGVKANQAVPDSRFKFDIPKGADVIKE